MFDIQWNIKTLTRNTSNGTTGATPIDNLGYTYATTTSHFLSKISDSSANAQGCNLKVALASATYSYDATGNMFSDPYQKITAVKYYYHNNRKDLTINTNFLMFT